MAVRYIPYYPDTLEGQALLDNFVRTQRILKYHENGDIKQHIMRGMPYYETTLRERVGKNENDNLVMRGDCLSACAYLKDKGQKVDLVYIDPPFASGADYAKKVYVRRNPKIAKALKAAEQDLNSEEMRTFEEKMYGDIWDKERYLNWMYENLMAIKSVMSDNASIYVHLDYHIGHYVKILMDEIFGEDNFRNEIIWKRSTAHNDSTGFANLHDSIFYYSKGSDLYFKTPLVPYSDEYIDKYYNKVDADGRKYLDRDLSAKGLKGSGYSYVWKGKNGYWRCPLSTMERLERENRIYYTSNGTPRYKQYLDEMEGVPAQDLWLDIFAVNSQAGERVDYATQKPEALLERIINASSDKGMVVADFFGGSGVTAAVANRLGRRFIHCDVGINSIETTRDRLIKGNAEFDVMDINDGVALFRNPAQTMDKLQSLIQGLHADKALGKQWAGSISDTRYGNMPVWLPDLKGKSFTRMLDDVLINKIIREDMPDLPDETKKVIVYYIDIDDEKAIRQFIHENNDTGVEIELRDLKNVLDNVVMDDKAEFTVQEVQPEGECFKVWQTRIDRFFSDRVDRTIKEFNLKGEQQAMKGHKKFVPITISEDGLETIEFLSLDCTTADITAPWHSSSEILIDRLGYVRQNGKDTKKLWDGTITSDERPQRLKIRNICGDETIFPIQKKE
ncbi:MAG: site-specific DNA-methyltransferase [Prevotella sp.]|nr:site-specific DNA-methyltransferase [Prevotella sp.]MDY6318576.1 site-specific DNA-methyltransferase [Prevotella sp.]